MRVSAYPELTPPHTSPHSLSCYMCSYMSAWILTCSSSLFTVCQCWSLWLFVWLTLCLSVCLSTRFLPLMLSFSTQTDRQTNNQTKPMRAAPPAVVKMRHWRGTRCSRRNVLRRKGETFNWDCCCCSDGSCELRCAFKYQWVWCLQMLLLYVVYCILFICV